MTVTGPFTGAFQETWESFPNYSNQVGFYLPDPTAIMGGNANISSPSMAVYQPGAGFGFGLGGFGPAPVSDGAKAMGLDGDQQTATIVFNNPVDSFGAYWGVDSRYPVVSVSFFDVFSNPIGYDTFGYSGGALYWHGWNSDVGISRITYFGPYIVIDGLQANGGGSPDVPELPAPLLAAIPGAFGIVLRRRK